MEIEKIVVMGAGQMGAGIAQVAAQAGYDVVLHDVDSDQIQKGLDTIRKSLDRFVEKGKISAGERDGALERIAPTPQSGWLDGTDLLIEAVPESPDLKKKVFREVADQCGEDTIFASNTSSISITDMGRESGRPDRFIGMHFMNPVPLMKLVEIIRGEATSDAVHDRVAASATRMGKTAVTVQDYPGFISNRILMPMINEAVFALMEGAADRDAIDTVMRLGMNHPMGPLKLADLIGLDTCLSIMEVLHEGFGDSKYRPCPLLRRKVQAGHLGRKSGKGFYDY